MPKFLIVGPTFYEWDLGFYLQQLLREQDLNCRAFAYLPFPSDAQANAELVRRVREWRPDFILGIQLEQITPESLQRIRRLGTRIVHWYVDCFTPQVPLWIKPLLREVDLFLTSARGMLPKYRAFTAAPVHWMYEGVYLPAYPSLAPTRAVRRAYGSPVAFIGSIFQPPVRNQQLARRRLELFTRIGARYPLRVWGPQVRLPQSPSFQITRWPTYHQDYVRVCRSSAIMLGVNTVNSVELYFSNRTFHTLASGGFHLTEYVPSLEELFENQRHLVWYKTDEECLELIAYYLKRPTARARIAEQGREFTRRRYSMRHQLNKILNLLKTL
ncbi:MAG TPA: glycosyltransferase [Anaerolineae bacterium]|nr:glycosyltransferase [Anaerolineae bacterium]